MYAIMRLGFPEWREFGHLTFPYFRPRLEAHDPDLFAYGATLLGRPVGLLLARGSSDEARVGEIHSLFVDPDQGRLGIASRLMQQTEEEFRKRRLLGASVTYMDGGPRTPALEGLLRKLDWDVSSLRLRICRSDFKTITQAPWMARRAFPSEYEVFQWADLTAVQREEILLRQRKQQWFPELLSPFSMEDEPEPVSSLGLRYKGEVVGWCISHRVDRETIRFARLFIRRDLRGTGRAMTLLAQSIYRHENTEVDKAVFEVSGNNTTMLHLVERHMVPYMTSVRNIVRRYKRFAASGSAEMAA